MLLKVKTYYQRGRPPYSASARIIDADAVRLIEPIGDLFVVHVGDVRNDNIRVDAATAADIIAVHNAQFGVEGDIGINAISERELSSLLHRDGGAA